MQVHVCTQVYSTVVENQNLMQCDFLQAIYGTHVYTYASDVKTCMLE